MLLCLYLKSKLNNKIIQIKCYDTGNLILNNMELWLGIQYKTDNELTIFKTGWWVCEDSYFFVYFYICWKFSQINYQKKHSQGVVYNYLVLDTALYRVSQEALKTLLLN